MIACVAARRDHELNIEDGDETQILFCALRDREPQIDYNAWQ